MVMRAVWFAVGVLTASVFSLFWMNAQLRVIDAMNQVRLWEVQDKIKESFGPKEITCVVGEVEGAPAFYCSERYSTIDTMQALPQ